jgi:hypothetical protein
MLSYSIVLSCCEKAESAVASRGATKERHASTQATVEYHQMPPSLLLDGDLCNMSADDLVRLKDGIRRLELRVGQLHGGRGASMRSELAGSGDMGGGSGDGGGGAAATPLVQLLCVEPRVDEGEGKDGGRDGDDGDEDGGGDAESSRDDSDDEYRSCCSLAPALRAALVEVHRRFDSDGDGSLSTAELQDFARACNDGDEFEEEDLEAIWEDYGDASTDEEEAMLSLRGFLGLYLDQTIDAEGETWKVCD